MEAFDTVTNSTVTGSASRSSSPPSSSSPPPPQHPQVIISPCAACKILRRRCAEKCVLAPYFPPTEPSKFTIAHRVFGASNIIKFLQELPESQRADAVSSMVYEAGARIRDPVYGCAGAICQLQKQVNELQAQLAKAQAELVNMQCQQALLCMELAKSSSSQSSFSSPSPSPPQPNSPQYVDNFITSPQSSQENPFFGDNNNNNYNLGQLWEPLWT